MATVHAKISKKHSRSDTGYADWGWLDDVHADAFSIEQQPALSRTRLEVKSTDSNVNSRVRSITMSLSPATAVSIAPAILAVTGGNIDSVSGKLQSD